MSRFKYILAVCACLFAVQVADAQTPKYWVYFKDKPLAASHDPVEALSPAAIQKRDLLQISRWQWTDVAVSPDYLQALSSAGASVEVVSKWLNAATCRAEAAVVEHIRQLPFVEKIVPVGPPMQVARSRPLPNEKRMELGMAARQMNSTALIDRQLTGKDVLIGVIDAGFYGAPSDPFLKYLFEQNRILGIRDMVSPQRRTDFFNVRETSSDDHGTTVLQMIAGLSPDKKQYGLATGAKFYLARTDHGDREFRAEEDYWIASMEWMDSLGVRIINTSLGYAQGFDNPNENYKPEQMDGKTAVISRAAQIAAEEKGLLLVIAAGNEGSSSNWKVVSAPADAQGVLSVGATTSTGIKAFYSSIGPDFVPYLKPNVSCLPQVSAGTSFSAPMITGFAACLMQFAPDKSAKELIEAIEKSGNIYPLGNNFIGYGIPDATRALNILQGEAGSRSYQRLTAKDSLLIPVQVKDENTIAAFFHKSSETKVIEQGIPKGNKSGILIKKHKEATRTTVVIGEELWEIVWE
ncbi:S8 family serine peptidase [Rhodoflexus sp.]